MAHASPMPPCPDCQHERELREQWIESHELMHSLGQRAIDTAHAQIDGRLREMNELRAQINNERGMFITREFHDQHYNILRDSTDLRLKLLETSKSNLEGRLWMMGAGISAIVVGINLLFRFIGR